MGGGCTLATTGALLFVNGIGGALGPLGAGFAMEAWGPTGLFLFLALASGAVGLVTAYHRRLERLWIVAR